MTHQHVAVVSVAHHQNVIITSSTSSNRISCHSNYLNMAFPPETMEKGSGMKLPLLVGGIFSSAMGSAGHSVPHCCGRQSQGCSQKSLGCDVLGSSKTKGCSASCRFCLSFSEDLSRSKAPAFRSYHIVTP